MKNKHELPNGVTLEVGKKYIGNDWLDGQWIEVLYLGEKRFFYKDYRGSESSCSYANTFSTNLIPYTEPKKKVKVAKYAFFNSGDWKWKESKEFYKSDEEFEETTGRRTYIRLTHTEIEVDDY